MGPLGNTARDINQPCIRHWLCGDQQNGVVRAACTKCGMETDFVQCEYPFWWNNLVAALDSVSLVGLTKDDEQVSKALDWLIDHQEVDGLWRVSYASPDVRETEAARKRGTRLWVSLAICRVLKRLL